MYLAMYLVRLSKSPTITKKYLDSQKYIIFACKPRSIQPFNKHVIVDEVIICMDDSVTE